MKQTPRGHDWTATVRYIEARRPPGVPLAYCHDDGRPIPSGARCYRRVDARQGYPLICLPCHEKIEHQRYRHTDAVCCRCGEPIHWASDVWLHQDDAIIRRVEVKCHHCGGRGCRRCINKGTLQVDDHRASPDEAGARI